jgi:hypothetical protein
MTNEALFEIESEFKARRRTFSASEERALASLGGWPHTETILRDAAKWPLLRMNAKLEYRYVR